MRRLTGGAEGVARSLDSRQTQIQVLPLGAVSFQPWVSLLVRAWNENECTSKAGLVKIKCKVLATLSCKPE